MKRILSVMLLMSVALSVSMGATKPKVDLTKQEVKVLIATAKTPEDHLKLAQYYDQRAELYLAESKDHEELAEAYRKNPMAGSKFFPMTAKHCEETAKSFRKNAAKMKELAAAHRTMAEKAAK
jgi:hypothetical protein